MFRTVPLSIIRISFQNKYEKSVHLVGFIIRIYKESMKWAGHAARERNNKFLTYFCHNILTEEFVWNA